MIKPSFDRYIAIFNEYFGEKFFLPEDAQAEELEKAAGIALNNNRHYLYLALLEAAGWARLEESEVESSEDIHNYAAWHKADDLMEQER